MLGEGILPDPSSRLLHHSYIYHVEAKNTGVEPVTLGC